MKRNALTLSVGLLLLVLFGFMLTSFQVRQNEIALVTTFGKPSRSINADLEKPQPGLYFKWPWPIQRVQLFDKRIQNFEGRFEPSLTQDKQPLLISVYAGWTIADPALFRERFAGSIQRAESDLEGLLSSAKSAVVGQYPFSAFISTDEKQLKFTQVEKEILASAAPVARANYGIQLNFLGIERLGLPESITQKVFDRMKEERQRFVAKLQADGESKARDIRSQAERERQGILSQAESRATRIRGEGDALAAKHLAVFEQNPELALLILKTRALEQSLTNRATLILDERTPPFDLLNPARAAKSK